jgi:lysyl endopeptidase
MNRYLFLPAFCLFFLFSALAFGQPADGKRPVSFTKEFEERYGAQLPEAVNLPEFDLEKILKEDETGPGTRFAAPIHISLGLEDSGEWTELDNGDAIWRLRLRSQGAIALAVLYDEFYLPPGAALFMYSEDRRQLLGAYTFNDNPPGGRFWTGLIEGEAAVLEYYEPAGVRGQSRLHIFRVDHAYHREKYQEGEKILESFGFGASMACNVNINCPAGANWQNQKRGICRIIMVVEEGMGYCSGSLMNNTNEDGTPYILGAYHCQDGYTPLWDMYRFDFNYEGEGCNNPVQEPPFNSLLGSTYRAGRQANDFILLELLSAIPTSYNLYFNGWDRRSVAPANTTIIHHPRGDIRKITHDQDAAVIFNGSITWDNGVTTPPLHHFRVQFEMGTFESGSSGSPLFNQDGRVVGQLHGGTPTCSVSEAFCGRLSMSWNGGNTPSTRLRDWLDPAGLNPDTLDGKPQLAGVTANIGGMVITESGVGIGGVTVTLLEGEDTVMTTTTGPDGLFEFEDVPAGIVYGLNLSKNYNHSNGVSTLDLIRISKHVLSVEPLGSPLKMIAADVNASQSISTLDIIRIQKVILGVDSEFSNVESWRFVPLDFEFSNPANPFQDFIPPAYLISNFTTDILDLDFYGVKSGDVNESANPGN